MLVIYIIAFIAQLLYFDQHQRPQYVPKRKQWRRTNEMTKWISKQIYTIATIGHATTYQWHASRQSRTKVTRARRIANRMQPRYKSRTHFLIALSEVAMSAQSPQARQTRSFDTDSGPIGIDNRCTGCISHKIEDFQGPLRDSGRQIKGFGGTTTGNIKIGTIVWRWQDDQGRTQKFVIPNSFYSPDGGVRLLSPQHWARTQKDFNSRYRM